MATIRPMREKWQAIIRRKGYPTQSKSFELRKDAEKWGRQQERLIDAGEWVDRKEAHQTTVGDLLKRYATEVSCAKRGKDVEVIRLATLQRHPIARYSAAAVTGQLLAEWRDKRLKEVSTGTVAREMQLISHVFAVAIDAENKMKARVLKTPYESLFAGDWTIKNPLNAEHGQTTIPRDRFRWSVWAKGLSGEALVRFMRDEVFAFFAEMGEAAAHNFMDGARLSIIDPTVLTQVVNLVDGLRLDASDSDTKGDLFEHVLRQIRQAGELGQFRTPRHVIRTIVEIIDPKVGETIYDPAAGTAGFLVAAYNHIRLANSSPSAIAEVELDGKKLKRGLGDKLSAAQTSALQSTCGLVAAAASSCRRASYLARPARTKNCGGN